MKKHANIISTIVGYLVAVSTALVTIDWKDFDIKVEWPKLVLSTVIAIGGHLTRLNTKEDKSPSLTLPPFDSAQGKLGEGTERTS